MDAPARSDRLAPAEPAPPGPDPASPDAGRDLTAADPGRARAEVLARAAAESARRPRPLRGPDEPRRPRPDHWLDEAVREAEARGLFRCLPGRGRPLPLGYNPFEPEPWRLAHRLLRQHGFAPEWIELDKQIRAELEAARAILDGAAAVLRAAAGTAGPVARGAGPEGSRAGAEASSSGRLRRWTPGRVLSWVALRWLPGPRHPGRPRVRIPARGAGTGHTGRAPDLEAIATEAERRFLERIERANGLIARYNLVVPIPWLQRRRIDPAQELASFRRLWQELREREVPPVAARGPGGPCPGHDEPQPQVADLPRQ